MKKKAKRRKIHRKMKKTSLDLTLKLHLEGHKRIIQNHRSWVIKMLASKQEDN